MVLLAAQVHRAVGRIGRGELDGEVEIQVPHGLSVAKVDDEVVGYIADLKLDVHAADAILILRAAIECRIVRVVVYGHAVAGNAP